MFGEAEGRSRLAGSVETKPDRAKREMVSREGIEPSTRRLRVVPDLPDHRRNRRIQAIDSADGGISRQIAATYAQRELSRRGTGFESHDEFCRGLRPRTSGTLDRDDFQQI
jgi:hypothetical protein